MTEQSIRDDLADLISEHTHTQEIGWEEADELADAILASPVIRRIQAEALREATRHVYASNWWADGSDNYASKVRGWLTAHADRTEEDA